MLIEKMDPECEYPLHEASQCRRLLTVSTRTAIEIARRNVLQPRAAPHLLCPHPTCRSPPKALFQPVARTHTRIDKGAISKKRSS